MGYLIAVDAGGTKTAASVLDAASGKVCATHFSGSGNLSAAPTAAQQNITQAITLCMRDTTPDAIVIGAAGISGFSEKDKFIAEINGKFQCPVTLVSDAELGLYSAFAGEDGILVIAGTGSIAYAKKGNQIYRAGGWGHLLGDEGGGCGIMLAALRCILTAMEANQKQPAYGQAILHAIKAQDSAAVLAFVSRADKAEIAARLPLLDDAANQGDLAAVQILKQQGRALAQTVMRLCKTAQFTAPRILTMGSVLLKSQSMRHGFTEYLQKEMPQVQILIPQSDFIPQRGAYYLWKKGL